MSEFLGIARERLYSPGKVDDDRAILEAVAERLRSRHRVRMLSADDGLPEAVPRATVFTMCQSPHALAKLQSWERAGVRIINSTTAIESCHRRRMIAAFERKRIKHPASVLVASDAPHELPEWVREGAWLKRGDVHATEADDVIRVADCGSAQAALAGFRRRRIESVLVQKHLPGDVIKFYAVRDLFFTWLPVSGAVLELSSGEQAAMCALAQSGAEALGLEIYGGDCVRDREGGLWLIDLNDWPSYAPCRAQAADAIRVYLEKQSRTS